VNEVPADLVIGKLVERIAQLEKDKAILLVQVELLTAPKRPDASAGDGSTSKL
jgi:hypothetical protein